jgi:hypothetical protein
MLRALALCAALVLGAAGADAKKPRKHHRARTWHAHKSPKTLFPSLHVVVPAGTSGNGEGGAGDPAPPASPDSPDPGPAAPPPASYPSRTGVDEDEYFVHIAHLTLAAGPVELNVHNFGMDDHDITVQSTNGFQVAQEYLVAGQDAQLLLNLPAGTYKLYCSLYDGAHDQLGMNAELTVK